MASATPHPPIIITSMQPSDWEAVRSIYLEGIATGQATFETTAPTWEHWDAAHCMVPRLIIRQGEEVAGWGALTPASARYVYRGVAECSIYIGARFRGLGLGARLMHELVNASEDDGFWTLQAMVFPENRASLRLCEICGFRLVGVRQRIGSLDGRWRDVLLLERRSTRTGL
jgi:L-amino acid N-acyltransferase YncA